jgi:hypothetical protein
LAQLTVNRESCANTFCVSLHLTQTKVPISPLALCDFIDALAIVYNNNLEKVRRKK